MQVDINDTIYNFYNIRTCSFVNRTCDTAARKWWTSERQLWRILPNQSLLLVDSFISRLPFFRSFDWFSYWIYNRMIRCSSQHWGRPFFIGSVFPWSLIWHNREYTPGMLKDIGVVLQTRLHLVPRLEWCQSGTVPHDKTKKTNQCEYQQGREHDERDHPVRISRSEFMCGWDAHSADWSITVGHTIGILYWSNPGEPFRAERQAGLLVLQKDAVYLICFVPNAVMAIFFVYVHLQHTVWYSNRAKIYVISTAA